MKFIEDKLEKLDAYFAPKKENEKWLFILGVAGIIGYLGYTVLLPYTQDIYKKSEKNKKSVIKSIANNKTYLKSITVSGDRNYYVKQYDNKIIDIKKNIANTNKNIIFINKNLAKLSDMLFNQKSWSIFLNSITQQGEVHNIDFDYIENKYVDNNGSFGHVLEVGVGVRGSYKNIVKFINELEQNVLVADVYETKLVLDTNSSDLKADIRISVWGINH